MDELVVLKRLDLQWTMHVDRVWKDVPYDVRDVHANVREDVRDRIEQLVDSEEPDSPLGYVMLGEAGSGKTHLLASLRKTALEAGAHFVLVDMTDVRDVWETILLGYLKSLHKPGTDGEPQFHRVLAGLPGSKLSPDELAELRPPKLVNQMEKLIGRMALEVEREAILQYRDVVKALVLFASSDMQIASVGFDWLQGTGVSESSEFLFGFGATAPHPRDIVAGLSWLMSLSGPTLLALDQLDAIVSEHNAAAAQNPEGLRPDLEARVRVSRSIIEGIGHGLMGLRDVSKRTLTLLSSLQATWAVLQKTALSSSADRFEEPRNLRTASSAALMRDLVASRLAVSFERLQFEPLYPTWPFKPEAFETTVGWSPRLLLKRCDAHRHACVSDGRIVELASFSEARPPTIPSPSTDAFAKIDRRYAELVGKADAGRLLHETNEDDFGDVLGEALHALAASYSMPDHLDLVIEDDFRSRKSFELLHARLRIVDHQQNDREQHYCLRYLQREHHTAFQARLRAAITESGIDRDLGFRQLTILRSHPLPAGKITQELVERLHDRGGQILDITADDAAALSALHALLKDPPDRFRDWVRARQPLRSIAALKGVTDWADVALGAPTAPRAEPPRTGPAIPEPTPHPAPRPAPAESTAATAGSGSAAAKLASAISSDQRSSLDPRFLPVGRRVLGQTVTEPVALQMGSLTKHVAVLASAGSGKTVLVRRMIEEAALRGVPSIVVDVANDLSLLGEEWPERPSAWSDEDAALAAAYRSRVEVCVWTPGRASVRPLVLAPLPDFTSVAGDPDELQAALDMARESLVPIVIAGRSNLEIKKSILTTALRELVRQGLSDLQSLATLLRDLPADLVDFEKGTKLALDMGELLQAKMTTDPMLGGQGTPLDPAELFGIGNERTRVSVINLSGLNSLDVQQSLVNQLAMTLFTWVKKHPLHAATELGGLFVIDEAKDFVPANKTVACSESLKRSAAQLRKYGVGMIVATQQPKSIDHNVTANCTTHVYGKAGSQAAIDAVREGLQRRGGRGDDIARLETGQFYVHGEGFRAPVKVHSPLCLSHHPQNPPSEDEVVAIARRAN